MNLLHMIWLVSIVLGVFVMRLSRNQWRVDIVAGGRLKSEHFAIVLGFALVMIPVNAKSTQRSIGWSKSEYDTISAIKSRADSLAESKMDSCRGVHAKSENIEDEALPHKDLQDLKREIDERLNLDQDARLMDQMTGYDHNSYAANVVRLVDAYNLPFVRQVYSKYGVLGSKDVGSRSTNDFLVLVIHADKDRSLQLAFLKSIDKLPMNDPDRSLFSSGKSILKNRELYKPKANKRGREIDIPYQPPGKFGHSTGPQSVVDVLTHWYPWYVQSSLGKHLLEKARSHPIHSGSGS